MSDLIGSSAGSGVVPIDPAVGPVTGHPRQASLSTCVKKRISRRNRNCPPFFRKVGMARDTADHVRQNSNLPPRKYSKNSDPWPDQS